MPPAVIDIRSADDSRDVVHRAVQALAEGKVVAFPTETVYSIAVSALDDRAVDRLLIAKRRNRVSGPFPWRSKARRRLGLRAANEPLGPAAGPPLLARPGDTCLPRRSSGQRAHAIAAAGAPAVVPAGAVGLRVPASSIFLDVMRMMAGPLAMSSANRTGQPESKTAADVVRVDRRRRRSGVGRRRKPLRTFFHRRAKSRTGNLEVLRAGVVSEQTLRRLASFVILLVCTGNTCRSPMAEIDRPQALGRAVAMSHRRVGRPRGDRAIGRLIGDDGRRRGKRGGRGDRRNGLRPVGPRKPAAERSNGSVCRRDLDDDANAPPVGDRPVGRRQPPRTELLAARSERHSGPDRRFAGSVSACAKQSARGVEGSTGEAGTLTEV